MTTKVESKLSLQLKKLLEHLEDYYRNHGQHVYHAEVRSPLADLQELETPAGSWYLPTPQRPFV